MSWPTKEFLNLLRYKEFHGRIMKKTKKNFRICLNRWRHMDENQLYNPHIVLLPISIISVMESLFPKRKGKLWLQLLVRPEKYFKLRNKWFRNRRLLELFKDWEMLLWRHTLATSTFLSGNLLFSCLNKRFNSKFWKLKTSRFSMRKLPFGGPESKWSMINLLESISERMKRLKWS